MWYTNRCKMKPSLKNRILTWLRKHPEWHHGEEITKLSQAAGYEGETGRRRLRDLLEEGLVMTESRKGQRATSNWYKAIGPRNVTIYSIAGNVVATKKVYE